MRSIYLCSPLLVFAALALPLVSQAPAQQAPERFWLAGRYDGNRVIVYFDTVKFGDGPSPLKKKLVPPASEGFLVPYELPKNLIAGLQKGPGTVPFAVGDRYDLLGRDGSSAVFTLTSFIGFEGDEGTGNDSYIGALGTLDEPEAMSLSTGYFAARRHQESERRGPANEHLHASLLNQPVRFDIQGEIAAKLTQQMRLLAPQAVKAKIKSSIPAFEVQSFNLSNGSLHYYVRAEWQVKDDAKRETAFALGAWIKPLPAVTILAIESQSSSYGFEYELPKLLNVVDLGSGETGIIVSIVGEDSYWLELLEYREGADLGHMPQLQIIGSVE